MSTGPAKSLQGQVALVTGAASGLGAAIAEGLGAEGAAVCVNYRGEPQRAEEVVRRITSTGATAFAGKADVSRPEEVTRLVEETVARFGALDILVANAGLQRDAALLDMTPEDWNAALAVDLTGTFFCIQAASRVFVRQGVRPGVSRAAGKIICISSVHEVIPWAGHANYAAAKGGVHQLMRTAAQELAQHRIRVNAIAPGAIKTDINKAVWEDEQSLRALTGLIPYGRLGTPEDVAAAAVWLASDQADYVTGTTLFVDGGMQLYAAFRDNG